MRLTALTQPTSRHSLMPVAPRCPQWSRSATRPRCCAVCATTATRPSRCSSCRAPSTTRSCSPSTCRTYAALTLTLFRTLFCARAHGWQSAVAVRALSHMRHGLPRRRPLSDVPAGTSSVCTSGHCSSFQPSVSGQQSGQAAKRDHLNSAPVGGRVWPPPRAPVAGLAHRRDMAVSTLPQFTEKVVNRTLDAKCAPARPARALASRPIGALGGRRARTRL